MEQEAYVRTVVRAIECLPPENVVARVTGDGASADLLAPDWSRRKRAVLAAIDKAMIAENTWQGKRYKS